MTTELNRIIDQIASIDSESSKIIENAHQSKVDYAQKIKSLEEKYDASLYEDMEKEIQQLKLDCQKKNEAELSSLQYEYDKKIAELDFIIKNKSDKLAEEIFSRIIKE